MTNKDDRKLGRRMLTVYQDTSYSVAKKSKDATCKKGCASCCHLIIGATFPEAVAVAEHVLTDPRFSLQKLRILKRIHEQVALFSDAKTKRDSQHYVRAQLPCPFLDPEEKTCQVYSVRPSSCRLHYSKSDPELCGPTSEKVPEFVDTRAESVEHLQEAARVSKQTATPLWSGPFPIMLIWAFKLLQEGREAIEEAHRTSDLGIASLHVWRFTPEQTQGPRQNITEEITHYPEGNPNNLAKDDSETA